MKIVLINHSFQVRYFYRRWQLLAQAHPDLDVTLLAPAEYEWYKGKNYTYDGAKKLSGKTIDEDNFHIRLFRVIYPKKGDWTSPDFKDLFLEIQPDIVYNVGSHQQPSLLQVISIVKRYLPQTKVMCFSMRGPNHDLVKPELNINLYRYLRKLRAYRKQRRDLNYVNYNVDAIFCHYPDAFDSFRREGYKGPLYMQTQVGVNEEWFHEDKESRKEIREKYNLRDAFVFGSASRFTPDKGIDDILNALPKEGNWRYLMMGKGSDDDNKRLSNLIESNGLKEKVIMTGFVDWYDMAKYWNAVDCAIHVPRTTPHWVETFSLAAVQPQITKKPVIGNTSGSVPYQIGFDEMLVPEGDIAALREKIVEMKNDPELVSKYGQKMYARAHNSFEVQHLNELFYETLQDVMNGVYDVNKVDMAKYANN